MSSESDSSWRLFRVCFGWSLKRIFIQRGNENGLKRLWKASPYELRRIPCDSTKENRRESSALDLFVNWNSASCVILLDFFHSSLNYWYFPFERFFFKNSIWNIFKISSSGWGKTLNLGLNGFPPFFLLVHKTLWMSTRINKTKNLHLVTNYKSARLSGIEVNFFLFCFFLFLFSWCWVVIKPWKFIGKL